eukprot:Nitzschia sp. Nitz4//scaffold137_size62074//2671//3615//NITZ4_006403-RA/size62074-processed-gene-0.77-mRNA-1//-1//CDS//3329535664//6100//frame0
MKDLFLSQRLLTLFIGSLALFSSQVHAEPGSCSASEDGVCTSALEMPVSMCKPAKSLYSSGGSAQAYLPNAPLSNEVCRVDDVQKLRYKPAGWPYSRRNRGKGKAPRLDITLHLWSCEPMEDSCYCNPLEGDGDEKSYVEVWQPQPNGEYSKLSANHDATCRATVPIVNGTAPFSTVAPGSTGVMGGLGPAGWDWAPFGQPVIHFLVKVQGHTPLLVDYPVALDFQTLDQTATSSDFRGLAWVRKNPSNPSLRLRSWVPNVAEHHVELTFNVFLPVSHDDSVKFCPSLLYGLPGSFFLEPISVCAPSMMDFLPL